jgi:predicted cobalt transporter CbtA
MPTSLITLIGRGAVAGGAAGLLSGAVSFLVGERWVNRAIELEEAAARAAGDAEHPELFSRTAQQAGLFVVAVLSGVAIGVLFAIVYAVRHRNDPHTDAWSRAIWLSGAGFVAVALIPFLRYPANPPAVGAPGTVGTRTSLYIGAVIIGLVTVFVAGVLERNLRGRETTTSLRQSAVGAVIALGTGCAWLLPANTDPIAVPADLIWNFRLASILSLAVLWVGLGIAFGLLGERAERHGRPAAEPGDPTRAMRPA